MFSGLPLLQTQSLLEQILCLKTSEQKERVDASSGKYIWDIVAEKYKAEFDVLTPGQALDFLSLISEAGYQKEDFWRCIGEKLVVLKGFKTDLQSNILMRNLFVKNLPNDFQVYSAL